ncbi:TetR/AcrR family transcriptional regulator (plasmid) [Diaphorobacter sp. HDW4B]|uniref:TetR/AcrR family transcriptional regulator n=1 Tax=Diaphorobacter sp. HDW4B TaxID=2714925 RepID=UPI00140DC7E1|nr:TetR/AcrR family transcriptional regulator [Diaphorobacter sp. HDW4B]QIL74015.1 TetR/AcrR family transcriptional regulator [Diaphorobacter sp. HDW4B]
MARPLLDDMQVTQTRQRLTIAALELYREVGIEAVTFRELGRRVGISHVTPYRYFSSKEELMNAVRTLAFELFEERLLQTDRPRLDPVARLRRILFELARFGVQRPDDYRLLFEMRQPALEGKSPLMTVRMRSFLFIAGIYRKAVEAGNLKGNPLEQVMVLVAGVHGLVSLHVANQLMAQGVTVERLLQPMLNLLLPMSVVDPQGERSLLPSAPRPRRP